MACVRRGDEHPAGEPSHGAYQPGSRSVPISAKLRHMTRVAEYPLRFLVKGTALRGIAGAPATGLCVGGPCQSTGQNQVRHPICKPICKRDAARRAETRETNATAGNDRPRRRRGQTACRRPAGTPETHV